MSFAYDECFVYIEISQTSRSFFLLRHDIQDRTLQQVQFFRFGTALFMIDNICRGRLSSLARPLHAVIGCRPLSSADVASSDVVQGPAVLKTRVHRPSPSLINLPGLRSLPFWTSLRENGENRIAYGDPMLQRVVGFLEENATIIRDEYVSNHEQLPSDYDFRTEHDTLHQGQWDWHSYMTKGKVQAGFFQQFPKTFDILQQLRKEQVLFEGTPFGYSFFSKLHPKSRIKAHTAPMNFRLRVHLPLIVPTEATPDTESIACGIRVGPLVQRWTPGKAMVLDDAFEHEVWNETDEVRVLLLVDLWHPDILIQEREDIVKMFLMAKEQGWYTT